MNVATRRILLQVTLIGFFILGSLAGNARAITGDNLWPWISVSILTALACTVVIDLVWLHQAARNGGRPLQIGAATAVSILVGAVFALTQFLGMQAFELVGDREPLLAAVSSIVTITIIGVAISSFLTGRYVEEERRGRLLEEGVAVALVREDVADIVHRMQVALGSGIDDALAPARRGIEERLADQQRALNQDEWAFIARELRSAAHETVRPLSQQLWSSAAGRTAPIGMSQVLRNIVTKQPLRPVALALILIVTSFASTISLFGWGLGLIVLGMGIALIFLVLGLANAGMNRWPSHHAAMYIAGALILQLGAFINFPLREWQQVQPYSWAEAIAAILIGLVLVLLTSGAGSLRSYRDDVARTFQAEIDRELIESIAASRQVAQLARESARLLHGAVQTRLIACAVAIERASQTRDAEAFQAALHEAHDVLAKPMRTEHNIDSTLSEEVQRKVSLWSGLCSIDVSIDPETADMGGRTARDVGRVVEEGMSNAIRHGFARAIHLRISKPAEGILLRIDDDGCGPQDGPRGLGSALLDSLSREWSLTPLDHGARLSVLLASGPDSSMA